MDPSAGALLVGNFGNGQINAYNPDNGHFLGTLRDAHGQKIKIDGLWALAFGNGVTAGDANTLYFTAGPADESHGLFGSIRITPRHSRHEHDDLEAVGADQGGGPHVKVFDESDGEQLFSFMAYDAGVSRRRPRGRRRYQRRRHARYRHRRRAAAAGRTSRCSMERTDI